MARKPKPSGKTYGQRLKDRNAQIGRRPVRPKFLIVCEGSKTEPNYFKRFRVNKNVVDLEVIGLGDNTLSLVERTYDLMQEDNYAQVWCVFDRDSFPAGRFNEALALAARKGIRVAYSNEAFELWYLLHFHYHDAATSRQYYGEMLTERLGYLYHKNDLEMYYRLEDRQPDAMRNAQRLLDSYGQNHNPEQDNPSTTVHYLIQELNEYAR